MSSGETETRPEASDTATEAAEEEKKRLNLSVDIQDIAPCRKRIKVSIPPEDISNHFEEQFTELVDNAEIPGFRPGHAPRKLIERKYRKEVADQVKRKLFMESLEQLGEEHELQVISEPKIDFAAVELPEQGPMVYEFEVEVSPEFELPHYKGLKIQRPVKEFGEADVKKQLERLLQNHAQLVPKSEPAVSGDYLVVDVVFREGEQEISRSTELSIRIQPILRFRDGTIERFDRAMVGTQPGDVRKVPVLIANEAPNEALRGRTIESEFTVKDIKRVRLPELTREFLEKLGYASEEQLRDALHSVLRRRLEYEQRRVARQQLLAQLTRAVRIDLPPDLVKRQVQSTLRRRVAELKEAGFTDQEIRQRLVELQQRSISVTEQSLREHFLLSKIADAEELEVSPEDIENQIELIAIQNDESQRRVRARLEKEGQLGMLEIQILEQLAADRALEYAIYEDVPLVEQDEASEAVDSAAVSGKQEAEAEAEAASGTPAEAG
ncbi:MAG: trigger factor [Planctomycetes bacterium]|nr:trigger factor [Planctomycetota bacterium]